MPTPPEPLIVRVPAPKKKKARAMLANWIWPICSGEPISTLQPDMGSLGKSVNCAVAFGPGAPATVQLAGFSQVVAVAVHVDTWAPARDVASKRLPAVSNTIAVATANRRGVLGMSDTVDTPEVRPGCCELPESRRPSYGR